jgi:hypothetical protein
MFYGLSVPGLAWERNVRLCTCVQYVALWCTSPLTPAKWIVRQKKPIKRCLEQGSLSQCVTGTLHRPLSGGQLFVESSHSTLAFLVRFFCFVFLNIITTPLNVHIICTTPAKKDAVFCDMTPFVSCKSRRFGGTYPLLHLGEKNQQDKKNGVFWVVTPCGSYKCHTA